MNELNINIIFPEYENREYSDMQLYEKEYELFTCYNILCFVANKFPKISETQEFLSRVEDIKKRLQKFADRAVLGNFVINLAMDEMLVFDEYSLINELKSYLKVILGYDKINLYYEKNDYINHQRELYLNFISHEDKPQINSDTLNMKI